MSKRIKDLKAQIERGELILGDSKKARGARITKIMLDQKMKLPEFSEKLRIGTGHVSDVQSGKKKITTQFLDRLHNVFGASADEILYGIKKPPIPLLTLADFVNLSGPGIPLENFVTVPLVSGTIAATIGSGVIVDEYVEDWAIVHQKVTGKKKSLIAIRIDRTDGESMQPILGPGDVVIIDRDDRNEIKSMAIYAVRIDDGGATVKKLHRDNQHLLLVPENKDPLYKTRIIDLERVSENPVIGRVIWCSKGL